MYEWISSEVGRHIVLDLDSDELLAVDSAMITRLISSGLLIG